MIEYSATISACEKGTQCQRALEVFEELHVQVLQANVITYNATISACETGKLWERALDVFEELRSQGLQADVGACLAFAAEPAALQAEA